MSSHEFLGCQQTKLAPLLPCQLLASPEAAAPWLVPGTCASPSCAGRAAQPQGASKDNTTVTPGNDCALPLPSVQRARGGWMAPARISQRAARLRRAPETRCLGSSWTGNTCQVGVPGVASTWQRLYGAGTGTGAPSTHRTVDSRPLCCCPAGVPGTAHVTGLFVGAALTGVTLHTWG